MCGQVCEAVSHRGKVLPCGRPPVPSVTVGDIVTLEHF